jgi:poly(glycerol-phosphate) alpha-glucosyltransferase
MLEPWALRNEGLKKRFAALLYENRHLEGATCLRALCEAEAQSIRVYGLRNPICVIPNGVDLPDLSETPTLQSHGFAEGRKVLLYLGRLHPKKNVANLIRAWKQILNSHPSTRASWVLVIAGWSQGGYEAQLRQLTTDLGLLTSVTFLGPRFGTEKNECYRRCAAFIMPSLSEGLPMTVLEAWAYAKPVLMTPECNLSEGFAAGAALQIGAGPEEIAAGLKQVIEMSDDDRRAMGIRGRDLVVTKFSWPQIGEQMRSVYEWVLGAGPTPEVIVK